MKKQIALTLMAFVFAGSLVAQTTLSSSTGYSTKRPLSFFVEPSVLYIPSNNGLDDGFGGSISGGVALYENHLLNLEVAYFESDYDKGGGKMKFMPVTAGYQYAWPLSTRFQVRGGLFAGAMFEKSKGHPGISSSSRTPFTGGASLAFDYTITPAVAVGVSGKWMYVDKVKDLRERNMALIGLGCSVKF